MKAEERPSRTGELLEEGVDPAGSESPDRCLSTGNNVVAPCPVASGPGAREEHAGYIEYRGLAEDRAVYGDARRTHRCVPADSASGAQV
jgi:hypothetical protein